MMDRKKRILMPVACMVMTCILISTSLLSPCRSYAQTAGAGGYNRYRSRDYDSKNAEELDELEKVIQEDGYIMCTPENDWLGLKDTGFLYDYMLTEYQYVDYHIWVDKRDYEAYAKADENSKAYERGVMANNAVIVSRYLLRAENFSSENPTGLVGNDIPEGWEVGTIIINIENKSETQTDVIVTLKRSEDLQYYALRVNKVNGYHLTEVLPIGTYHITNVFMNDTSRAVYDPDLAEGGNGIDINPGDTMEIFIGFDTDTLPQSSWKVKNGGSEYIKLEPTKTPREATVPREQDDSDSTPSNEIKVKETKTSVTWKIVLLVMAGIVVALGIALFFIKKKNDDDNQF